MIRSKTTTVALFALTLALAPISQASAQGWNWSFTPYLWGSSVSMELEVNDNPIIGGEASFSDLLDKTEFALMFHFEGQRNKAGFFADLVYLDLANSKSLGEQLPSGDTAVSVDSELTMTIGELGALWNPRGDGQGFTLLVGARIFDIDQSSRFTLNTPMQPSTDIGVSSTLVDGLLAARYTSRFASRWNFGLRLDASTGGTDLAYNGLIAFGYTFGSSERFHLHFGYRHMVIELEEDENNFTTELEMEMSGPIIGFQIDW